MTTFERLPDPCSVADVVRESGRSRTWVDAKIADGTLPASRSPTGRISIAREDAEALLRSISPPTAAERAEAKLAEALGRKAALEALIAAHPAEQRAYESREKELAEKIARNAVAVQLGDEPIELPDQLPKPADIALLHAEHVKLIGEIRGRERLLHGDGWTKGHRDREPGLIGSSNKKC